MVHGVLQKPGLCSVHYFNRILKLFRHLARLEVSSRHVSAEWGIVYPWLLLHVFLRLASNVSDSSLLWSRHTMKYLLSAAAAGYTSWTGCCRLSN